MPLAPRQIPGGPGGPHVQVRGQLRPLLLLDFDKTITDFDAGQFISMPV